MSKIRVLIVDDSRTMRAVIRAALAQDREIEVVGEAGEPYEARDAMKRLNPDVVTLDVEMPKMNGLDFLEKIMRLRPTPVVMISSLTQQGAAASIEALALGAVDIVGKPNGSALIGGFAGLAEKVKAAALSHVGRTSTRVARTAAISDFRPTDKYVFIGASTGGVEALGAIIESFPANCPPTLITQHMPELFTASFAERLNRSCQATVAEAVSGAPLRPGTVYIAPGGARHLTVTSGPSPTCRLREGDLVQGHRPSVDMLFQSASKLGDRAIGVILTGMGSDGATGLKAMRAAGAYTIGQDSASSVVYGMPRAAYDLGAVGRQAPLDQIAQEILSVAAEKARPAV
ncbi:MAG: chemotaxis response regulator protein-glutamate methylesterase [Pseudomonadota bacterium]